MRTLVIDAGSYGKDIEQARLFLSIFGIRWQTEQRSIDISNPSIYETKPSSSKKSVTSLKTDWILSLASERCVALVCEKKKSRQIGLNGQQGTLNGRYAVEVYADARKGKYGMSGVAETICHEIMHALAEFHGVEDTLHKDLDSGKTIEQCREILLDKILRKDNPWGLLPVVARLARKVVGANPVKILEGYRSPERQDALYKQKPKVTNAKGWQSMHQYRVAFDYCFTGPVAFPPRGAKWNVVNVHARSLGLYSYGLEENFDDGHLELLFGNTEKKVMSRDIDWTPYWQTQGVFERDLEKGMSGEDVKRLQQYLNREGFTVAKTGAGSPGNETDYFGELTRVALAAYQRWYAITPALGYFGQKTREHVNAKS